MLVTSDPHLTDRPKDEYRFGIFKWLQRQQQKHDVSATFILGDLTENKDKHSAKLVNKIINGLAELKPPVYILKGNHDFIDPNNPFFEFLTYIDGIEFISAPCSIDGLAMIPHQPDQKALDQATAAALRTAPFRLRAVMLHQRLDGAIAETGSRLSGLRWPPVGLKLPPATPLLAGDIHKPQRLANGVAYVGAPYHIRFGDDFTPRVLLLKNGTEKNLYFPAPRKWSLTIRDADELIKKFEEDMADGDQVKITIELAREEAVEWQQHKKEVLQTCKDLMLEVFGVDIKVNTGKRRERITLGETKAKTAEETFNAFCKSENVASNIKKVGAELVQHNQSSSE